MLLPLVGFDRRCYRLGYGGGFYDRSLAQFRERGQQVIAVGLADEQHCPIHCRSKPPTNASTA